MIRLRLRPGRRRVLPALALLLACVPLVAVSSPTVDDVVAALRADDSVRARTLLDELRAQGLGSTYDVRFLQGVLHLRTGEGAEAARVFDELEASEGPAPALTSGRALSAWAEGRPAEARTRLEHATRLWPEDPGVWANLGDVYRALAARAYQRVRVLRRNTGAETPSPTAPALSAQPGTLLSAGAPSPPVLTVVPSDPSGSAAPTTAAESAAPTTAAESAAPATAAESAAPATAAESASLATAAESTAPTTAVGSTSPTAEAGSAAPTAEAGSTAPTAEAGSTAPTAEAGSAAPTTAAESAATAEAVAPAGAAGTTEARADSTVPADPPPSSGPTASSLPSPSPAASPPTPPGATPEPPPPAATAHLPSPEDTASVPGSSPPEAPAGPAVCFLAGPWPDMPPDEALDWLQARDAQVLSYQSRSSHYRVYLGPFEDRRRGMQTMTSLKKDMGIGDVAWVPAGPLRGAVSLGVYLKRESVDRRLRALHALGLDPKVQPPRAGSWLLGSTSDLEALLTEWPRNFPDVPLTPERCPPSR